MLRRDKVIAVFVCAEDDDELLLHQKLLNTRKNWLTGSHFYACSSQLAVTAITIFGLHKN